MLTACGIETLDELAEQFGEEKLQQCLPLAVLKLVTPVGHLKADGSKVATVLTACGIETDMFSRYSLGLLNGKLQQCLPLAVLKRS